MNFCVKIHPDGTMNLVKRYVEDISEFNEGCPLCGRSIKYVVRERNGIFPGYVLHYPMYNHNSDCTHPVNIYGKLLLDIYNYRGCFLITKTLTDNLDCEESDIKVIESIIDSLSNKLEEELQNMDAEEDANNKGLLSWANYRFWKYLGY